MLPGMRSPPPTRAIRKASSWPWLRHVSDFKENEAERGCALANAAVELPDTDHPARRVIREYKTALASGLFACVAMPSSPIPSVSPTKSFCYARAPALPPKVSDPKDFPRGSPECSRRWLAIMPDAASRVKCTAESRAAVGRASHRRQGLLAGS
jgi:hypothetical protein